MLSGTIFKTFNIEIFHFFQNDNQLNLYLGGVGWQRSLQSTPPKTSDLTASSFRQYGEISNTYLTILINFNKCKRIFYLSI